MISELSDLVAIQSKHIRYYIFHSKLGYSSSCIQKFNEIKSKDWRIWRRKGTI